MNWPNPSTCSWGHVAAFREEEFHPSRTAGAVLPGAPGAPGQQHPTNPQAPHGLQTWHLPMHSTMFVIPNAAFIAHCTQWSPGTGEKRGHGVNSYLVSTQETPGEASLLLTILFQVLIAEAGAQLKLRVTWAFSKLCLAEAMHQCHRVTLCSLKCQLMVKM